MTLHTLNNKQVQQWTNNGIPYKIDTIHVIILSLASSTLLLYPYHNLLNNHHRIHDHDPISQQARIIKRHRQMQQTLRRLRYT